MESALFDNATTTSTRARPATPQVAFGGFQPPTSNTTYTPNQFFDVCIPHFPRGVVRIVAFLIRKTLGWCNANGEPHEEQIEVSYSELEQKAGVSRDMIRDSLDMALEGRLIECAQQGRPKLAHDAGQSAAYQLRWDDVAAYKVRLQEFGGFFEGEGNRTDIPNEFFDVLIPNEPLSVIKVVGAIIRHSIGFQARHGMRRQQVALSYQQIQNYTRFGSRSDLAKALRIALEKNYIVRLEPGVFSPYFNTRHSATYALRWSDSLIGQKIVPAGQSENRTSIGQIFEPADRSEIRTSIKTKLKNETLKQPAALANPALEKLQAIGLNAKIAARLAQQHSVADIEQQIAWLPQRAPARNPVGLLRAAIEENWPAPLQLRAPEVLHPQGRDFARFFYAAFAGNQAEPVNEPSVNEAQLAQGLVARMLESRNEPGLIPEWGRALAKMARAQRDPFPSVTLAIRQFGDALFVQVRGQSQQKSRREQELAREAHLEKYQGGYRAFLVERETEIRSAQPQAYADFVASRDAQIAELARQPAAWTKTLVMNLRSEESRLHALSESFALPDFWGWDADFNPHRFRPS